MKKTSTLLLIIVLGTALPGAVHAERDRLYTEPDASCQGGIKGHITSPKMPIQAILAIPPDEPRLVYNGTISGADKREFSFSGLPMRKYDLFVIFEDRFYEGLQLTRGEEMGLTSDDTALIEKIIQKSEPFFTVKVIHRLEGKTGDGSFARCLCTFLRDAPSRGGTGYRRTFKTVTLKDVGPGWQVVVARDLYPLFVPPERGRIKHNFCGALMGIRVTDYVKDMKDIDLAPEEAPGATAK